MSLSQFIQQLSTTPALWVTVLLTLGVILVNGWTDAPNAIASCVATRALKPRAAIIMAAVFNFLGVLVMTLLSPKVAETIYNMVDFGSNAREALIALCAAMFAIVVWAVLAWAFGIPPAKAMLSLRGLPVLLSRCIIILTVSMAANGRKFYLGSYFPWPSVLLSGISVQSSFNGFVNGQIIEKPIGFSIKVRSLRRRERRLCTGRRTARNSFLLGLALSQGNVSPGAVNVPVWLMILCSLVMAFGTSIGGMKIIKSVGMDMVKLEKYQGFAADISATAGLLICSVAGMPVSTTHAKTTAIMGVGAAKRFRAVNWGVAKEMVLTWILTFPGCGLIGFLMTKLFVFIF